MLHPYRENLASACRRVFRGCIDSRCTSYAWSTGGLFRQRAYSSASSNIRGCASSIAYRASFTIPAISCSSTFPCFNSWRFAILLQDKQY